MELELSSPALGLGCVWGHDIQLNSVEFGCNLHLSALPPWEEKRYFQSNGCLYKASWQNVWRSFSETAVCFSITFIFLYGIGNYTVPLTP